MDNGIIFNCLLNIFDYLKYLHLHRNQGIVTIHETEIKRTRRKPDFDVDTVIVALRKKTS